MSDLICSQIDLDADPDCLTAEVLSAAQKLPLPDSPKVEPDSVLDPLSGEQDTLSADLNATLKPAKSELIGAIEKELEQEKAMSYSYRLEDEMGLMFVNDFPSVPPQEGAC